MGYKYFLISLLVFSSFRLAAQYDAPLYTSYTTRAARAKLSERLVKNAITGNLSLALADSTEENWEEAFDAMEVLNYKTPFTEKKVRAAFDSIASRGLPFQRALLEVAYTDYAGDFLLQAQNLLARTSDPKIFAMCAEYVMQYRKDPVSRKKISQQLLERFGDSLQVHPILHMLQNRLKPAGGNPRLPVSAVLKEILGKNFLPGRTVMYSFQRKNRDYPGLVLIRNGAGRFITDSAGNIFYVPQLARSITNLPGYLSNGNTPEGIFRMYGFGVSMSSFIGPTANVQMGMPTELTLQQFFGDSTITDSVWTLDWYRKLVPLKLKGYLPLYDSYYAGLAGRSEIIAHGSTIDPQYYTGKPYYPLTPTQGCLCTREVWDGKRLESDQQKLVNGLLRAGGANGYCVVIELNDKQAPVNIRELLPFLPR